MNKLNKENVFHFIHFHTRFFSTEGRWAAALGGLGIPHGQQQFQKFLLAPQQDGAKQGRRCSHSN